MTNVELTENLESRRPQTEPWRRAPYCGHCQLRIAALVEKSSRSILRLARTIPHRSDRFGIGSFCGYAVFEWLGSTWQFRIGVSNLLESHLSEALNLIQCRP